MLKFNYFSTIYLRTVGKDRRMKKSKIILTIILFLFIFTNNCTYASMADYTDEDAEKDTQRLIQEHKENFDSSKSDNNYLKELTVNGGTISPNFDRQVKDYSLKIDSNINEIDIIANPEDTRAKVKGDGKIDINNISECKIEVVSESGTTRTYFIKIIKANKEENANENIKKEDLNDIHEEDENIIISSNIIKEENLVQELKDNKNINKYAIGLVTLILVLVCIVIIVKSNKRTKH